MTYSTDDAGREMTLAEWCARLPDAHRVNVEYRQLKAQALGEDGNVLVPREPTKEMARIGYERLIHPRFTRSSNVAKDIYRAMLAAAPSTSAQEERK